MGDKAAGSKVKPVSRLSEASQFFMAEEAETLNAVEEWPAVDTDSTSERVIELLNQAQLSDREAKISFLKQVQELIVNKDPTLLDNFLDELLVFQQDRSPDVRRFVVGFIEEACKKDGELLPKTVEPLAYMLNDEVIAVQKRVILGVTQLYKFALQYVCKQKSVNEDVEHMWEIVLHMKEHILNLLESDNDGIRTHAIKFMEMIILCQSLKGQEVEGAKKNEGDFSLDMVPRSHPFIKMTDLREEGGTTLEALLTFIASPSISGVNLMAALGSLTSIAQKRPTLMSTVVQAFESLHANLPTTLSKSQVSSVRKNLKLHLFGLMKHQSSVEFLPQISTLLTDLGATQAELQKNLPKISLEQKRPRPAADSEAGGPSKKQKVEEEAPVAEVMSAQAAIEMTSEAILPKLNKENVVELIILSMLSLPNNMPSHFQETYTPIAAAGGRTQKAHLARLLGAQMFNAGIGAGVEKMRELKRAQQDPRLKNKKEEAPQSISVILGTGSGNNSAGSGKSMDMDNSDLRLRTMGQDSSMDDREDDDKDKPQVKKAPIVPKPHQVPQLRMRKIKPFKLSDVTRILTPDVRNNMMVQAMKRILAAERSAIQGGVMQERLNIIVGLVSQFGGELQKGLQDFIVEDPRSRYELAVEWLYKQYLAAGDSEDKQDSYNNALTSFLEALKERLDAKDKLFTKFLLEAPMVTDGALNIVRSYCEDNDRLQVGFATLRELAMKRPASQQENVQILLQLSTHEKEQVRVQAIHSAKKLHCKAELSEIIEQHALASLKQLLLEHPPHQSESDDRPPGEETAFEWTDDSIKLCLYLYLALLPLNHKLFHELAIVYTDALPVIKRTILRHLEHPVRAVGMTSPELLKLVETCPAGAETLITRILHIITDKASPSPELVKRVKELYHKRVSDVRFLIPVLTGLEKQEVIEVLPKLIKQSPNVVKEVFNRLLGCFHGDSTFSARSPLSPSELLIALHNIENKSDMKSVMKAISLCFAEKTIYTQEVLAVVLQQLMEYNPLPTLFMRTVIQSLSICPRLVGFVMNILSKLITKQVWKQPKVWQGFVKCCQMTKPQSFSVLLQLPPRELESAFEISPELCDMLVAHVQSFTPHQKAHIPRSLLQILEKDPKKEEHKKSKSDKSEHSEENAEESHRADSKTHRRHKSDRKEKKRSRRDKPKTRSRSKRGENKESDDESSRSEGEEPMET